MNDQEIMENLLLTTKGVCDLYMHGAIESSTQNVHCAFDNALNSSLRMQDATYKMMASKGWYPCSRSNSRRSTRFARNSQVSSKRDRRN